MRGADPQLALRHPSTAPEGGASSPPIQVLTARGCAVVVRSAVQSEIAEREALRSVPPLSADDDHGPPPS